MKLKIYARLLLLLALFIILGMTPGVARGGISAITDLGVIPPWKINMIDSASPVGQHVSVAIDRGKVFISYYDNVNKDLRLARYVGTGGNCGPDNTWQCQMVESIGDVGQYNSIAAKPSEADTRVFISYYNATAGSLKYATGICNSTCTLTIRTIDSGNPSLFSYKGKYTSAKYDSNGIPHISYYYQTIGNDSLMYAHMVDKDTGNCGTGADANDWQCDTIQSGNGVGMYTSLALDADGDPHIAYYDSGNDYPIVASYVSSVANNSPLGSWQIRTVQQPTLDTGKYVSLAVEDNGRAHIAYYNATNETLEYAKWRGGGGNCGFSSSLLDWEWQCEEIADMGTSLTPMGISLALDKNNYPMIAYQDTSEDLAPAALKIAFPGAAYGLLPGETNCGPEDLLYTWYCGLVDGGGSWTDEAGSASMALNSSGLATIAYYESDDYYLKGNLKIAFQYLRLYLPLISRE
jgi:hypothetical protein